MKKYIKLIFVFVTCCFSLMFIDNVKADSNPAKMCIYEYSGYSIQQYAFIQITNDEQVSMVFPDGYSTLSRVNKAKDIEIKNWKKTDDHFNGKEYYRSNDYKCPPILVYDEEWPNDDRVFFADESTVKSVMSWRNDDHKGVLVADIIFHTASDEVKKKESSHTANLPLNCKYENQIQGKKLEISFTIDINFEIHDGKYTINNEGDSFSVMNDTVDRTWTDNLHTAFPTVFGKTNSCPEYVFLAPNSDIGAKLYFSPKELFEDYRNTASRENYANYYQGVYSKVDPDYCAKYGAKEFDCSKSNDEIDSNSNSNSNSNPTSTSNSNKTSTSNSNKVSASNSNPTSKEPNAPFMVVSQYKSCGKPPLIQNVPSIVPRITASLYNAVMVIVPVIFIIMGSIDLVKGIASQKEDEMKKGREAFIKRLIGSVIVFLIVLLVKIFVGVISGSSVDRVRLVKCIDCFISNECDTMETTDEES